MDAAIKAKWVEALRSGVYSQCAGELRQGGAYCCLGVLCNIVGMSNDDWESWRHVVNPPPITEQGLHGAGTYPSPANKLAQMNDKGASFAEIADYIEANL